MVMEMMKKENKLHEECQKELQKMKVLNSNMNRDMECIKKQHGLIIMELEESKTLNNMQQKKFTEELRKGSSNQYVWMYGYSMEYFMAFHDPNINLNVMQIGSLQMALKQQNNNNNNGSELAEKLRVQNEKLNAKVVQLEKQLKCHQHLELENQQLKGKLDVMKHMEDEFLKMVGSLHMTVLENEQSLNYMEDFNQSLIIKERENNDEIQKARKILIEGIAETTNPRAKIGLKRMGEIDTEPFLKALSAKRRHNKEEAEQRALEVCSLWQKDLEDPQWYPFKIITVDGKSKEIINEEDEKLKELKKEMGVGAYKVVVTALTEMNEYNPSGRFKITEMWNKREGRRATLEEGIEFLLVQTKTKRRKTQGTGERLDSTSENTNDMSQISKKGE